MKKESNKNKAIIKTVKSNNKVSNNKPNSKFNSFVNKDKRVTLQRNSKKSKTSKPIDNKSSRTTDKKNRRFDKNDVVAVINIIVGIIGVIVAVIGVSVTRSIFNETKLINEAENEKKKIEEKSLKEEFAQNLSNDYSLDYINSIIGKPVYKYLVDGIVNNYYIVNNNVLKCMFHNEKMVGYLVFININSPLEYYIWNDDYLRLGDFTYHSINYSEYGERYEKPYKKEYAFSGTSAAHLYYFEIYEGCSADTDGEYFLVGNYMDDDIVLIRDESDNSTVTSMSSEISDGGDVFYLNNRRDSIRPNVYGQIKEDYINKVRCIDYKNINPRNIIKIFDNFSDENL